MTVDVNIDSELYYNIQDYYEYENYSNIPEGILDIMYNYYMEPISATLVFNAVKNKQYRKFGDRYKFMRDYLIEKLLYLRMAPKQIEEILNVTTTTVRKVKEERLSNNFQCDKYYNLSIDEVSLKGIKALTKENVENSILEGKTITELYRSYNMSHKEFLNYCKNNNINLEDLIKQKKVKETVKYVARVKEPLSDTAIMERDRSNLTVFNKMQFINFKQECKGNIKKNKEQFILDFEKGDALSAISKKHNLSKFTVRKKILEYYHCDTIKIIRKYLRYINILNDYQNKMPLDVILEKYNTEISEVNNLLSECRGVVYGE